MLPDEHKPAGVRCKHLRAKGCGIYAHRPKPCFAWSCKWLIDEDANMPRPDHAGYAIDPMLDTVIQDGRAIDVIQIWVDIARRDAHRDPALREYLELMFARFELISIVRWGSLESLTLVPPGLSRGGWLELPGTLTTAEELKAKLDAL